MQLHSFRSNFFRLLIGLLSISALTPYTFAQETANDAVVPVPRDGNWMKRHESMNARVAEGNVDLVFIGDSITQGWEGAGREVWAEFYNDRNAVNLGISGDRTQHVIWRLENGNLAGIAPKLAVIMIGTNNSGDNTPEQIAAGVKVIVDRIHENSAETKILILATFPRGANAEDARRKVNEASNAIVSGYANDFVTFLDIGPSFLGEDGSLSTEIMPDLLHLSPQGYRIWAESIEEKVKELLGEE